MSGSPSLVTPIPTLPHHHHSPSASPRRGAGPSSPRLPRPSISSRLPSISASQSLDFDHLESPPLPSSRTSVVMGFSPVPSHQTLPAVPEASSSSPRAPPQLALSTAHRRLSSLSPQMTTPVEQALNWVEGSPRPLATSPRGLGGEFPPRSRRNSAAIVSISLSSRSRSRTPRGSAAPLPGQRSGTGTPNKGSSTVTPRGEEAGHGNKGSQLQLSDSWAPGVEEMDDWQPAGGMLLDGDDENAVDDDDFDEYQGREKSWSGFSDDEPVVEEILKPGMVIGEGLEFQGEVIVPAVGRAASGGFDEGLPLRRGGSEATKVTRADGKHEKKRYEVVRKLGTGSYAVVYLVKERGGRKREYALKCLSKQDLEEEQLETQLFEAYIHLSLPIHQNIVTLHQTLQTRKWLFLMLELCPGEDLFYWLEKSRDASPQTVPVPLPDERRGVMSSSKLSSSSIPFSSSQMFSNLSHMSSSFTNSPGNAFSQFSGSPASLLFAHHNGHHHSQHVLPSQTPPTPSLLSAFSANTLLSQRRLRLIASMFKQMCESVAVCHDAGVSHRDIKPENFICCDSIELEAAADGDFGEDDEEGGGPVNFGPQAKRKVIVKLTDFGLATTEEESGDVECGSKPYMSYECRNNLGPTYFPAPADVWSLGIVLINMLFHRNPWKDPTPGDPNFDNFLMDPTGFLLSKFTGIGREVASYLADHVLCIDVDARVSAREFGSWIKSLPDMIGGRKALHALKLSRLETNQKTPTDKGLFIKSPVNNTPQAVRKGSASALTSTAPTLSSLPPPSQLSQHDSSLPTPELEHDRFELTSATTVDEQPTPIDASTFPSPEEPIDEENATESVADDKDCADADSRSLSTHKRRKRGIRKGKAAKAAAAAAAAGEQPSQEERDALLAELTEASQSLAREISKVSRPSEFDLNRIEDFPPLGTTPAQAAAAKKSKWKDMMKLSQGNPEIAALARRVAERDANGSLNLSAPAKLQHGSQKSTLASKHVLRQTTTVSSGISSALSSFGPVSSATSSSGGVDDDDWRKPVRHEKIVEEPESRGRDKTIHATSKRHDEDHSRARKAALAAAAITGGMEPMGSFGKPSALRPANPNKLSAGPGGIANPASHYTVRSSVPIGSGPVPSYAQQPSTKAPYRSGLSHALSTDAEIASNSAKSYGKAPIPSSHSNSFVESSGTTAYARPALSSAESSSTITSTAATSASASAIGVSPNKPKLKGQISSLAKMLSGLKTKGKD
ncbi:serine/threonine protein kinase [Kwoniella heveanensis BCC8398]|uniref:Serine/threonine protein kinase n=1 Tax=Kwoniella heveanensis BCC8398 TaxID=1296120 RepID=A0A1B9GYE6_9TREE|nr:serine/threonine protein kinase [Kwoniella heveanensis BCC8398]